MKPVRISNLEVADLRVDRLSVSQIEAGKIVASEVDALVVTASELKNIGGSHGGESASPSIIRELMGYKKPFGDCGCIQGSAVQKEESKKRLR